MVQIDRRSNIWNGHAASFYHVSRKSYGLERDFLVDWNQYGSGTDRIWKKRRFVKKMGSHHHNTDSDGRDYKQLAE